MLNLTYVGHTSPSTVTVTCADSRLLAHLVNAEIEVRAKAPQPTHLLPGGFELDLLPDGRLQARLEFE